jgi:hypothetical protein
MVRYTRRLIDQETLRHGETMQDSKPHGQAQQDLAFHRKHSVDRRHDATPWDSVDPKTNGSAPDEPVALLRQDGIRPRRISRKVNLPSHTSDLDRGYHGSVIPEKVTARGGSGSARKIWMSKGICPPSSQPDARDTEQVPKKVVPGQLGIDWFETSSLKSLETFHRRLRSPPNRGRDFSRGDGQSMAEMAVARLADCVAG